MASSSSVVTVIESCNVCPPPGFLPDQSSVPLTFFDLMWLPHPPVKRLFFYPNPNPTSHFLSSLLPSLKSSLSSTLRTYYPLAGNYRRTPGSEEQFEFYYTEGDIVSFIVAECEGNFEEFLKSDPHDHSTLLPLTPDLPKSFELQPLLSVKVTIFPDQGIVIGTAVHHSVCDGMSSMKFTHSWAKTCRSEASSSFPIMSRALITDSSDFYSHFYRAMSMVIKASSENISPIETTPTDLVVASFVLTQNHIQKLKKLILAKAEERKSSFHCSSIVITFAYIWIGYVKAKRVVSDKKSLLTFLADYRTRMEPPVPEEYFGNCIGPCFVKTDINDLICQDGLVLACKSIGKVIEGLKTRLNDAKNWGCEFRSLASECESMFFVSGSPKFGVYDVDFGFGRPSKVEIISALNGNTMTLAESREEQGGIEIGLALTKSEMGDFTNYFFSGLKLLD